LFPLLELAEYMTETGDTETFERFRPQVDAVLKMLRQRRASHAALYPTDETPADDPIAYPYHLSSHILFWLVLKKLAQLGLDTSEEMQAIGDAIQQYFIAEHDGSKLFAYASDGAGSTHLYHDANDFPTVLAPLWGFCSVDDPIWRATMDYAFSDANTEGFYNGHLGSVHTRAAWPLGDVQDIIVARLLNDQPREAKAFKSLQFAAQRDGALPEAYNPATGEVVSRHWFAWPNAAYACVILNAFTP
jgi:meiotically up-regulated gene 157 (Mug157) protein